MILNNIKIMNGRERRMKKKKKKTNKSLIFIMISSRKQLYYNLDIIYDPILSLQGNKWRY